MASTFTPNLGLEIPARGDYPNQWDNPMDASLNTLDTAAGGSVSISGLTGGTQVLTQAQANATFIYLSGSLAANQVVAFPPIGGGRKFIIPSVTLNGFGLYIRGNNGADLTGVYFLIAFGIPYGIVVTPGRVYWDYGGTHVGALCDYPMSFIPPGWIPCDGRGANTTSQDLLFDLIGYSFGGSGPTFLLPDLRGRVRPMADDIGTGSAGRFFNLGILGAIGQTLIGLALGNMPSHTHGDYGHGHPVYDPGHEHGGVATGLTGPGTGVIGGQAGGGNLQMGNTAPAGTGIGVEVGYANLAPAGSGVPFQTVQPSFTVMTCIRW
jgi:microcystin-dependent protein